MNRATVMIGAVLGVTSAVDVGAEPTGLFALEVRRPAGAAGNAAGDGPAKTEHRSEIWTVRPDGSDARCLIQRGDHAGNPQWSLDGGWLYFQSDHGGTWQIYRCRPDGSGLVQLTRKKELNCYGYTISRDGRMVAYACHPDSSPAGVALMLASGRDPRFLVRNRGYNYMPSFHPDGKSLAFASTRDGNYEVYRINTDGTEEANLTRNEAKDFFPQWGPDGKFLFFFRSTIDVGETFRMNGDGSHVLRLTKGARHDTMRLSADDRHGITDPPAISPDGRRMAYIAKPGAYGKVFVMTVDGSDARMVAGRDGPCFRVKWSPDGEYISFVSWVGSWLQLFVVDPSGAEPARQVTNLDGSVVQVSWGRTSHD